VVENESDYVGSEIGVVSVKNALLGRTDLGRSVIGLLL
jgi:hypothetical protein